MNQELMTLMENSFKDLREHSIVKGIILDIKPQVVLVDIGYKSEGAIPVSEFEDEDIQVGDEIEVLLQRLENDEGMVVLSKEKAAHKQNWDKIVKVFLDGGLVKGKVKGVVKGGLTVNVGVEAFLPGSQIDIIPPKDLNEYVGNVYEFKIVKVNDERKNVVLSRREVIEAERAEQRQRRVKRKVRARGRREVGDITAVGSCRRVSAVAAAAAAGADEHGDCHRAQRKGDRHAGEHHQQGGCAVGKAYAEFAHFCAFETSPPVTRTTVCNSSCRVRMRCVTPGMRRWSSEKRRGPPSR